MTSLQDLNTRLAWDLGMLGGLVLRYEAALKIIATHGNMSAAIARHALQHDDEHDQQHEQEGASVARGPQREMPEPDAEEHAEQQEQKQDGQALAENVAVHGSPRWWIGWYDATGAHAPGVHRDIPHAWMTGESAEGEKTMCAVVEAPTMLEAWRAVLRAYTPTKEPRFIVGPRAPDWFPEGDRFSEPAQGQMS